MKEAAFFLSLHALPFLDFAGITLFAVTGALSASRKQLDIVSFIFFGIVTGIGGGTIRDLMLGVPVFWVESQIYILLCTAGAIFTYFVAPYLESRYRWLIWLDAGALAAYSIYGAQKGLAVTGSPVVAVVMGVLTGVLGGIIRDVLASEPSVLMRREVYILAAMAGALTYVVAVGVGLERFLTAAAGVSVAFCIRAAALAFNWGLPQYKPRPGRDPENVKIGL